MHEMNLALTLLRKVQAEAGKAHLQRVTGVELELGTLQAVDAELLTEAFKAAALGTPAEGAELRLHPVPALADCLVCGESYAPSFGDYHCPACGRAEPRILRGQDLILTAVTGILSEEHYV